jgi:Domain of unknown function (DUF4166)
MTSIFQSAMGADFDRLHPRLQRRFSVGLAGGEACVGRGMMNRVWHRGGWVRPFLALGATRHVLLPHADRDVPFVIENYPYEDSYGRETVTFGRTFLFPHARPARWDATMIYSPARGCVVDYLGTHQHLATDLEFTADPDGSLVIRSTAHRFREGRVDVRVPHLIGADATVRESYDEAVDRFRIQVSVANRRFGPLFGYEGSFDVEYIDTTEHAMPARLRPVREEARE